MYKPLRIRLILYLNFDFRKNKIYILLKRKKGSKDYAIVISDPSKKCGLYAENTK